MPYLSNSYKSYFNHLIENAPRGVTTALATYLNCRPGFVSQVLKGESTHFSLEHILKTCQFFKLDAAETNYLLLLGQFEKAGSHELQAHFKAQLQAIQDEHRKIKSKVQAHGPQLSEAAMGIYYSHWAYTAVHMLPVLTEFRSVATIAKRLKLTEDVVSVMVEFLVNNGLLAREKDQLVLGKMRMHLPQSSPLVRNLHQNWRLRAVESLAAPHAEDLHYSVMMTLAKKDISQMRQMLLDFIKEKEKVLIPSPDEEAVVMNLDLFRI